MPSFTETFGGQTIYPAQTTYLALTITADATLAWPIEQSSSGNVVADIIDVSAGAGLNVNMPDARQTSNGTAVLFNNVGSNTVTIRDSALGTIVSLTSGTTWQVYLSSNATAAGTWRTFQFGASVSTSNAAALAGSGLKAVSTTLNQSMPVTSLSSTPYTVLDSDRAKALVWTSGVGTFNLPSAATVGSDWFVAIRNSGSGTLTVTPPSGTIDGSATKAMSTDSSMMVVTDGTNYFSIGYGVGSAAAGAFDFLSINVAGAGDYTLAGAQLNRIGYKFTGVLTGTRNIVVPNTLQEYWVDNGTTGAFSLYVKTVAQAPGISITQADRNILYCDSTNVIDAESSTVSFPIPVAQGGTAAVTAAAARTNLGSTATGDSLFTAASAAAAAAVIGAAVSSVTITAGAGLTGGGDLTANRTLDVGAGTGITVNANDVALDTANTRNVDHSAVTVTAGAGLTGGGDITATRTLDVGAGTGITVNANDVALDTASTRNTDHTAVTLTASTGLSGGGDISANRSFSVDRTGTDGNQVGYLDAPQNIQNAAYPIVITDRGKQLYHSSGSAHTYTIPANASVAFPIGSIIDIVNDNGAGIVTIAITTDTLRWWPGTNTGSRSLAANGSATIKKITSTSWAIQGVGLT